MNGLGVTEVIMGAARQTGCSSKRCASGGAVQPEQVCYMGDDIPDLPCAGTLQALACCPHDAATRGARRL